MEWYIKVLKNYANFKGRARRKEYWMFTLINILIGIVFGYLIIATGHKPILMGGSASFIAIVLLVYQLGIILPTVAVGVRRLHDTGYSGWWYLLILTSLTNLPIIVILGPLALIIFFCLDGVADENHYGPDPKQAEREAAR